ncbi:MAG: TRAM domain-containing protein [bacterium]|nr:TRAM domain-containing protein [bacterium]
MLVKIDKLVHGGQGLGMTQDGKKVFVWGALQGEEVEVLITKNKKDFAEGFAEKIIKPSAQRINTLKADDIELSTQPLKIMSYDAELIAKQQIVQEIFSREHIVLPEFNMQTAGSVDKYRNKVEFSFWGDDQGIHYAHYLRASHRKIKLPYPYNSLVFEGMSKYAGDLLKDLNELDIRAGDLKSVIIRSENPASTTKKVGSALFVKTDKFPKIQTSNIVVYYSNPKSPASVATKKLYANGTTDLSDTLLNVELKYDVMSFFQVNLPVFELALKSIKALTKTATTKIDMYSGVGAIGIPIGNSKALIELDENNVFMARKNAAGLPIEVIQTSSEKALEYVKKEICLIVDPPRAGLHKYLVQRILGERPKQVVYLSCNPATQARDIKILLDGGYTLEGFNGYNFFPRTPHIETLANLVIQ